MWDIPGEGPLTALLAPFRALSAVNTVLLSIGRFIAWICLGIMVLTILVQIVWRYMPGLDALNWTEEFARFLMLWMTGLIAPSGYRWGGFVAIDMVPRMMPRVMAGVLMLVIFLLSLMVLITGVILGYGEVTGFGGRFTSPSLWIPFTLGTSPFELTFEWVKMPKKYMFASLWIGCMMLVLVNIELVLRSVIGLINPDEDLPDDPYMVTGGAD